ncbi:DUF4097 domain-containing protein [Saccharomonospora sp. CUA-673]|uniref:DUF4097 domain-containing protein n=1 Tax=Saccharomonospora sp. CUA-673 TaxID=1904969 RepID=UPI0011154074|nr:DUF4097 domain-containing protein [Saccharomonospora sp. CUA-673]
MGRPMVQRPALAVGGIAVMAAGVVLAFGWFDETTTERTSTFAADEVDRIAVDVGGGNVAVRVEDVDEITVVERFSYRWNEPGDAHSVSDGALHLDGCAMWCRVDHEVVVPRALAVDGEIGSGTLDIEGASSADVRAGSGTLRLSDVTGDVQVDVGSGTAEFTGIGGEVVADAGSGSLVGRDLRGAVEADAGSGRVDLELAEAADVTASVAAATCASSSPTGTTASRATPAAGRASSASATTPTPRTP